MHVLQAEITGVAGANPQLAVKSAGRKSFHTTFDDKAGHALVIALPPLLFIGPAKEKKVVRRIRQTDPHLFAIQDIFVAFASRG